MTREEATKFAESEGMTYFETSAKTNANVETMFKTFSGEMKQRFAPQYLAKYKQTKTYTMPIKPVAPKSEKKMTCCWYVY